MPGEASQPALATQPGCALAPGHNHQADTGATRRAGSGPRAPSTSHRLPSFSSGCSPPLPSPRLAALTPGRERDCGGEGKKEGRTEPLELLARRWSPRSASRALSCPPFPGPRRRCPPSPLARPGDRAQPEQRRLLVRLQYPVGKINWDPYESTMKHDFVFKPATDPDADCARAGKGHVIPFQADEPTARNIYKDEYCWKPYSKAEPIRSGSASGIRRNNPQPGERFLIWQMPREEAPLPMDSLSPWTKPITKQEIEEVLKKQYKTSYARDYLGIQPGAPRDEVTTAPDWKTLVPRPPDTEFRRHFRPQTHAPDLKDFTWKYGCNAKRHIPVKGAVPSVSFAQIWNHEHTKQLSTYQRDFGKDYLEIVSVLHSLDPEDIKAYVDRSPQPEKEILQNFLDKVNKTFPRPSSSKKTEENSVKCI